MQSIIRLRQVLFCLFLFFCIAGFGQSLYLEKPVTLHFQDVSVAKVFKSISSQAGVVFSYTHFDDQQKVTINVVKKQLKNVLPEILKSTGCTYKIKGKYIILNCKTETPKKEELIQIEGYIHNAFDSLAIESASVYIRQNKAATTTNKNGYFHFSFAKPTYQIYLSVAKEGFFDTLIRVDLGRLTQQFTIYLKQIPKVNISPLVEKDTLVTQNEIDTVVQAHPADTFIANTTEKYRLWQDFRKAGKELLDKGDSLIGFRDWELWKKLENSNPNFRNIEDTLFSYVSFSLIPFVSTNHLLSINTVNHASFNLFAGYSKGVDGIEIGGFLNIDNGNVRYLQLAGFGNVVTGNVEGIQVGGFANILGGNMNGIQFAGFSNYVRGSTNGIQFGGFANHVEGRFNGVQGAGFLNFNRQLTEGIQASGFLNITKELKGIQASGFSNFSFGSMDGLQIASFMNVADTVDGAQLAAFMNISGHLKGTQLGLFNFNESATGIPFGVFSYVHSGYHKFELAADERATLQLSFRTGVDRFHNIFIYGRNFQRDENFRMYGYGLGAAWSLSRKFYLGTDLTAHTWQLAKTTSFYPNVTGKFFLGIEYRPIRKINVAIGPTFNLYLAENTSVAYADFSNSFSNAFLYKEQSGGKDLKIWMGAKGCIRFL